ncbi:MAG: hypothetical protein QXQ91_04305 [Nanopusillaceae archaeon]
MAGGRFRGVAPGVAVAVVVIAVVSVIAVYQVMRAYSAAYTALVEYAVQAQKPVFRVTSVSVNSTHAIFRLVNEGPVAAYVRSVLLFQHRNNTEGPVGADVYSVGLYVPVGGAVEVSVPLSNLTRYIVADQPVRFAVETDRGPVITSMDARGEIRVNIVLSRSGSQVTLSNDRNYPSFLSVTCPAGAANTIHSVKIQIYPYAVPPEGYTVTWHEGAVSVHGRVPAIGPCLVTLNATLQNPVMLVQDWSRVSGVDPRKAELAGAFAHSSLSVSLRAVADVRPGYMSTVDFNIPEVYALRENFEAPQAAGSYVVDFSWYFFGEDTRNPGKAVSNIGNYTGTGNFVVRPHPYIVTARILASGALTAYSPKGCVVYPTPSMNPPVIPRVTGLEQWDWYEYTPSDVSGNIGFSTGAVLIVPNPLNSTYCPQPLGTGDRLLVAEVPVRLATGRHMVVPVFTYDDTDGSNNFRVRLTVEVVSPRGRVVFSEGFEDEVYGVYGPIQYANPIVVDADESGVYSVRISVSYLSHSGGVNFLKLVVSKVVVVPIAGAPLACSFDAPLEPTFPFANVTMQTGTVDRVTPRPFIGRLEFRTTPASDTIQARNIMRNLTFWSNTYVEQIQAQPVRILGTATGACNVRIGERPVTITLRSPMLCPQGFSVNLTLFGNLNNPGTGSFIPYVDQGYSEDVDRDTVLRSGFYPLDYDLLANIWKPSIGLWTYFDFTESQGFRIDVRTPQSGDWAVLIPFYALTGGTFIMDPWVSPSSRGSGVAYYFKFDNAIAGVYVYRFTGSFASFSIGLPVASSRRTAYYFIQGVFVVPEFLSGLFRANPAVSVLPLSSVASGIIVRGVVPHSTATPVVFMLVEKDTGLPFGRWTFSPEWSGTFDVLLPVTGVLVTSRLWRWFAERPAPSDFVLVVQGARC